MTIEQSPLESALAAEVRAEMGRKLLNNKDLAASVDVSLKMWRRYFVDGDAHIPTHVLGHAADALGLSLTELAARAESISGIGYSRAGHQSNAGDGAYVANVEGDLTIRKTSQAPNNEDRSRREAEDGPE